MRKVLFLGILAALTLGTGCATVTRTGEENAYNFRAINEIDMRAIADDWNMIWMADRQTRLTRWYTR